jgi:hypothetical protein
LLSCSRDAASALRVGSEGSGVAPINKLSRFLGRKLAQ